MRNALRLALVSAVAAVALPAAPASAYACLEPLSEVCNTMCQVYLELGRPCPR